MNEQSAVNSEQSAVPERDSLLATTENPTGSRWWPDFEWPEWVPLDLRRSIEDFYGWHGGYAGWIRCAARNKAPLLGSRWYGLKIGGAWAQGRFVFAWNNMARLVDGDRKVHVVSFGDNWLLPVLDDIEYSQLLREWNFAQATLDEAKARVAVVKEHVVLARGKVRAWLDAHPDRAKAGESGDRNVAATPPPPEVSAQ